MSIMLDTPEQINLWVLLSRRHQVQLHLKGIKVPGILKWGKDHFPGEVKTVKDMVVAVETAISMAGGEPDFNLVNVQTFLKRGGLLYDLGVFPTMAEVEAKPEFVKAYERGILEIMFTTEDVREANSQVYMAG